MILLIYIYILWKPVLQSNSSLSKKKSWSQICHHEIIFDYSLRFRSRCIRRWKWWVNLILRWIYCGWEPWSASVEPLFFVCKVQIISDFNELYLQVSSVWSDAKYVSFRSFEFHRWKVFLITIIIINYINFKMYF